MDFITELYLIKSLMLKEVFPDFFGAAIGIGGITGGIAIVISSYSTFFDKGFDISLAFRPFCILVILSVFPNLVISPLDAISQSLYKWMDKTCEQSSSEREQLSHRLKNKIDQEDILDYDMDNTDIAMIDGLYESSEESRTELPSRFQRWIMDAMVHLVEILSYVAQMFVSFLSVIYMIILSITGPLTFVLAIVPMFMSSIGSWLARYIQIMLWIPISHLIVIIMNYFHIIILKNAIDSTDAITWPTTIMTCLSMVMIIALFKIPTLCEWIVESTGGMSFNNAVNKAGAKTAGATMGMITKVIKK